MERKTVGIEELLGWAYRQELPKSREGTARPMFGSSSFVAISELGTMIDSSPNGFGCVMALTDDEPDPDALTVGRAVQELDGLDFSDLVGVDMLGDVADDAISGEERVKAHEDGARQAFGEDDQPRRRASIAVAMVAMLNRHPAAAPVGAIKRSFQTLGGKPRWFRMEWRVGTGGRTVPIEVDGYNRKSGRPHKDAYRKFLLSPELGPIVADRIDYQVWRLSLDRLALTMEDALAGFRVLPSTAPRWPWEGREKVVPARVWPSLRSDANAAA